MLKLSPAPQTPDFLRSILHIFTEVGALLLLVFTGGHINQDPPYTQKPIYYNFFADHIWSLLLCSPVIVPLLLL